MTAFRVGQLVVCVDDGGFHDALNSVVWFALGWRHPLANGVYTIRDIGRGYRGEDYAAIRLEEIDNGWMAPRLKSKREPNFRASRFRPVQPTSIEWAHELVNDLPKQKQTETV